MGLYLKFFLAVLLAVYVFADNGVTIASPPPQPCLKQTGTVEDLRNTICPFPTLREAMAHDRMKEIIAGRNVFQTLESNDVVRLQKGVGLAVALNPLKAKIQNTHKKFLNINKEDYTINIATYPAETQLNTCLNNSTIIKQSLDPKQHEKLIQLVDEEDLVEDTSDTLGVKKEISAVFGSYQAVKPARLFEVRNSNESTILCESSGLSLKEKKKLYCNKTSEDCQLPPSCQDLYKSQNVKAQNACISLNQFQSLSSNFLLNNPSMQAFCPDDCSYYIQLLQRVRNTDKGAHCAENYAMVHCGPKKTEAKYNLNIKVVDDFCKDFKTTCRVVSRD